jgi:predicted amidohydrolase YtcJ
VTVSHLDIIDTADYPRFRQLGVIAQYTPSWHGVNFNDPVLAALGDERYARTLVARPLFDDGAVVSFSSDVTSLRSYEFANPYLGMQIAHNRQYPQDGIAAAYSPAEIRGPESEQLPEAGKLADLVVLDQNLFEIDRNDIQHTKPVAVMMEGKIVSGRLN